MSNRPAGAETGCLTPDGYRIIKIARRHYRGAVLAWVIMTGEWPSADIDHKDTYGPKADFGDRWENLREASPSENSRNSRIRRDNSSGHTGVFWSSQAGRWQARINAGSIIHIGFFDDIDDAAAARRAAEKKYFGQFAPRRPN